MDGRYPPVHTTTDKLLQQYACISPAVGFLSRSTDLAQEKGYSSRLFFNMFLSVGLLKNTGKGGVG